MKYHKTDRQVWRGDHDSGMKNSPPQDALNHAKTSDYELNSKLSIEFASDHDAPRRYE